ncbi:eukaryotic translation initiation factor 3 subunit C-like [Daktulosphaira vitifoliae]|uniref:eukaryotic translation initiation factor 3 subunit C-like n=1 Tax=Daktulosphaira vitifoliae TaxID=58002 RepID=UPI0021AA8662|nr:eukaryotic translation initiation factor 3 subunit C-like [Daktulosphaira vitifoliae]
MANWTARKILGEKLLFTCFEDLTRAYTKAFNAVIMKEENGVAPRFFVRCLVKMEDFINDVWDDRVGRKNLSKNNSKSLASLRQKFRKYMKDFESDVAKFRENPDLPDQEEDEVDSDESEKNTS